VNKEETVFCMNSVNALEASALCLFCLYFLLLPKEELMEGNSKIIRLIARDENLQP